MTRIVMLFEVVIGPSAHIVGVAGAAYYATSI